MGDRFGSRDALLCALWIVAALPWLFAWVLLTGVLRFHFSIGSLPALQLPQWAAAFFAGLLSTAVLSMTRRWPRLQWGMLVALICAAVVALFSGVLSLMLSGVSWIQVTTPVGPWQEALPNALGVVIGLAVWFWRYPATATAADQSGDTLGSGTKT